MAAEIRTHGNDPEQGKGGWCWELAVDNTVVAVGPCWYQSEGEMAAAIDKAKAAFAGAEVVKRPY